MRIFHIWSILLKRNPLIVYDFRKKLFEIMDIVLTFGIDAKETKNVCFIQVLAKTVSTILPEANKLIMIEYSEMFFQT